MLNGEMASSHGRAFAPEVRTVDAASDRQRASEPRRHLNADHVEALRLLLGSACVTFPRSVRVDFLRNGWRKLQDHFACDYREIPAERFAESLTVVSSYIVALRRRLDAADAPQDASSNPRWRDFLADLTREHL